MGLFRAVERMLSSLKSVAHILEWLNLAVITYLKKNPFFSPEISIFYRKSAHFIISRNTDIECILCNLFESLKVLLKKVVTILMMSVKLITLGLHKIKIFWSKIYDVIISVHEKWLKSYCKCGQVPKSLAFPWEKLW